MCDALTGNTSQILWELKPDVTSQDIINLMCVRFGNAHDTERFRSELYSRNVAQGSPLLLFTRIYIGFWHLLFPVILTWNHGETVYVSKLSPATARTRQGICSLCGRTANSVLLFST